MTRVAIVGYGAIGRIVVSELARSDEVSIVAVAVKSGTEARMRQELPPGLDVVSSPGDLAQTGPDIVAECAGHGAVRSYGRPLLAQGIEFLVISTGVLADDAERRGLNEAARRGRAKLILPAGAIAGIDGLTALRQGGLDHRRSHRMRGRVHRPKAWLISPFFGSGPCCFAARLARLRSSIHVTPISQPLSRSPGRASTKPKCTL